MKKLKLLIGLLFYSFLINGQGSFYYYGKHGVPSDKGTFPALIEINGNYFIGGAAYNPKTNTFFSSRIAKMDNYGNIIKNYYSKQIEDRLVFRLFSLGDTIIRAFITVIDSTSSKLVIKNFDLNLNVLDSVEYFLADSAAVGGHSLIKDKLGNYIMVGGFYFHPLIQNHYIKTHFILKLSPDLDSLRYYEQNTDYFLSIIENPNNDLLYICGWSYNLEVFTNDLKFVKTMRIDTSSKVPHFRSLLLLDTNRMVVSGYTIDFWPNQNPNHRSILIKIIDTLGNEYRQTIIDAPDTIMDPWFGNNIGLTADKKYLYFTWKKNINPTFCNGGEPSWVGIAKYDTLLNLKWIRYFGNDTSNFEPYELLPTSDGGVFVSGFINYCEVLDPNSYYLMIKLDSAGNYTFIKKIPVSRMPLRLYPNPASDYIKINISGINRIKWKSLRISDTKGVKQMEILHPDPRQKIDIYGFSKGVYIIELQSESGLIYTGKFVKE